MSILKKELREKMTLEELEKFEELESNYMSKRFVESKILNKEFVPKWLNSLEEQFKNVPEELKEDLKASGELELKNDFVEYFYGKTEEDIDFGKYCKLFWVQRSYAKMLSYIDYLTEKYFGAKEDCSEEDEKSLKSEKVKGE